MSFLSASQQLIANAGFVWISPTVVLVLISAMFMHAAGLISWRQTFIFLGLCAAALGLLAYVAYNRAMAIYDSAAEYVNENKCEILTSADTVIESECQNASFKTLGSSLLGTGVSEIIDEACKSGSCQSPPTALCSAAKSVLAGDSTNLCDALSAQ